MESVKMGGVWIRILGAVLALSFWGAGGVWASVVLTPRVDAAGVIIDGEVASEDHVYLGEFKHRLLGSNGAKETTATPVLWRVMSSDPADRPAKAVLLAHHVLDVMAYQAAARPSVDQNIWAESELQVWLNSDAGFLEDFTARERDPSLMLQMDEVPGSRATAPTFWASNYPPLVATGLRIYAGELKSWFGENDYESGSVPGTGNTARKAWFKGQNPRYGWSYWTRTPVGVQSAWDVFTDGTVNLNNVNTSYIGVRPAFMLNLDAVLFKTTHDDAARVSNARSAGAQENPYILILPSDTRYGLTPFASADYVPSVSMNGSTMTLAWPGPVSPAVREWPHIGDFTLKRAGKADVHPVSIMPDGTCEDKLVLVFDAAAEPEEVLALDYNLNFNALSFDVAGEGAKVMAGFESRSVANETPGAAIYPTGISFLRCPVTLQAGETVQLEWELTPPEATERNVVFVLERSVATIDLEGRLTGISAGKITVRALTANGLSAVCVAAVENRDSGGAGPVYPTSIRFLKDPVHLKVGETAQLEWVISPAEATETAVTFSFDPSIVTVDENGVARGRAPGVTTVGVETVNGLQDTCAVMVEQDAGPEEPEPSDLFDFVRLEPESPPYYAGEIAVLRAGFTRPASDGELTVVLPDGSESSEKLSFFSDRMGALAPFVPPVAGIYSLKAAAWEEGPPSALSDDAVFVRELEFEAIERPEGDIYYSSSGGCRIVGAFDGRTLLPLALLLFVFVRKSV